jgi:hypothetical protein
MSTEDTMVVLHEWMADVVGHVHRAVRNMQEVSPGFSSSTPGNGDPGGGSGGGSTSIVERLVLDRTLARDDAVRDMDRLREVSRLLQPLVRDARDICQRWGYSTGGEFTPGARARQARPTEGEFNRAQWCTSCERLRLAEPIGAKGRRGLCRWCADFEDAEGMPPPLTLLDLRHRGGRITRAAVDQEKRKAAAGATTGPRPRKKKRR